ncbi:polysaccharide deacetylase family protein [Rubrolithibacter danxiaensis]|uniref:polysaccharide deacetylase family protein n=1 Tax=Rubrolithibacter danxiaensis TaxID=3390805 RepID=UPI003BF7D9E9
MKNINSLFFLSFFCLTAYVSSAQTEGTFAERLGFPKGKKVVILHVDDAGMSFDSNNGAMDALTKGVSSSCSVMMPCPWVPGFLHFLKDHPQIDAGLHLTLTSEWNAYRWGPLSGKAKVPGLVDKEGAMWPSVEEAVKHASADEVETEIRAQLDRALTAGFKPTHLDSHMGTLFATEAFTERYIKVGVEYKIPLMFPGGHNTLIKKQMGAGNEALNRAQAVGKMLWNAGLPVLDDLHNESYDWKLPLGIKPVKEAIRQSKTAYYKQALEEVKPGLTMVIMHCTNPTEVFSSISDSGITREGDWLAMTDPELKKYIEKEGIILTTWRELMERRNKVK